MIAGFQAAFQMQSTGRTPIIPFSGDIEAGGWPEFGCHKFVFEPVPSSSALAVPHGLKITRGTQK
jgi:hypothetical protein